MFQNEVKHVVLMPSSANLGINKEVTHNTRQNKIVGTQYREIQTTKVENFDPSLCKSEDIRCGNCHAINVPEQCKACFRFHKHSATHDISFM